MANGTVIFFGLMILSTVLISIVWILAYRLAPAGKERERLRWLLSWFLKGWALPCFIWTIMNIGISWQLQPFMPSVQSAQNSGKGWADAFLQVLGTGVFVVSSYWSALTLAWEIIRSVKGIEREARDDFKALCFTSFLGMILPCAGIFYMGGFYTVGLAVAAMFIPLAAFLPNILQLQKVAPMYARAIAKLKFGKYSEAEWEIIRELEKSEDDFDGWMMMAELYANQFRNLAEAEQTILDVCDNPKTTPSQLSVALHRLADWHLKIGADPNGARRALQMVCDRTAGTHLARMARLRLNQLPTNSEELKREQMHAPIPLPALGDTLEQASEKSSSTMSRREAVDLANGCVEKLKLDPNNVVAREKLARLFSEELNKPDMGIEQLNLLLEMPDQEPAKRAEWLGLAAAWHIKYRHDSSSGKQILEQLVREFPQSVQAFAARRRIQLMRDA